jgi:hypothetical protein
VAQGKKQKKLTGYAILAQGDRKMVFPLRHFGTIKSLCITPLWHSRMKRRSCLGALLLS